MARKYTSVVVGVGATVNSQGKKGGGHQIGYQHAEMYQKSPDVKLVAGIDINAENLSAFNKRFNLTGNHSEYAKAIAEIKPDIVSICTYMGLHEPVIHASIKAGVKAIICEKPFLASPAACIRVRQAVEQSQVKLVVAHPRRYRKAMQRVRQLIQEGAIGKVRLISCSMGEWDLNEMGAHWFDLIRFFLNDSPIESVMGQANVKSLRGYGHAMEESAVAFLKFANAARAVVEAGGSMVGEAISIAGTAGIIHIDGERSFQMETAVGSVSENPVPDDGAWERDWSRLWDELLADLVNWLRGGPPPTACFDSSVQTCEAVLAAYTSAVIRDEVRLPFNSKIAAMDEYPLEILARKQ